MNDIEFNAAVMAALESVDRLTLIANNVRQPIRKDCLRQLQRELRTQLLLAQKEGVALPQRPTG